RAWFWRLLAPFGRERHGFFEGTLEELRHDPLGIAHDVHDPGMPVDARKQKGAQYVKLALHGFRKRDYRLLRAANVICALWLKRVEPALRLGNGVVHHRGDDPADRLIEEARTVNAGIGRTYLGKRPAGDRHLAKLGEGEEAGAVAVIHVVIVVGDVVGKRSDLCLHGCKSRKFEVMLG